MHSLMVLLVALVMWAYLGWECKLGLLLSCWWRQSPPKHLTLSSFAQKKVRRKRSQPTQPKPGLPAIEGFDCECVCPCSTSHTHTGTRTRTPTTHPPMILYTNSPRITIELETTRRSLQTAATPSHWYLSPNPQPASLSLSSPNPDLLRCPKRASCCIKILQDKLLQTDDPELGDLVVPFHHWLRGSNYTRPKALTCTQSRSHLFVRTGTSTHTNTRIYSRSLSAVMNASNTVILGMAALLNYKSRMDVRVRVCVCVQWQSLTGLLKSPHLMVCCDVS